MILVVGVLLLLPLTVIRHGNPSCIADAGLTAGRFVVFALLVQIAILETPLRFASPGILASIHILSYLLIAVFFFKNRHIPGITIVGLGGAANFAAIVTNGGTMPASNWASRTAGLQEHTRGFVNSGTSNRTPLWILGDNFAIPRSWPLANVFSVGDILIVIGAAIFFYRVTHKINDDSTVSPS